MSKILKQDAMTGTILVRCQQQVMTALKALYPHVHTRELTVGVYAVYVRVVGEFQPILRFLREH